MVNVLIKEILDDDMSIRVRETWMPKWTEIAGLRKDKGRHFFLFTVRIKMPYPKEPKWLVWEVGMDDYEPFLKQVMGMRERGGCRYE